MIREFPVIEDRHKYCTVNFKTGECVSMHCTNCGEMLHGGGVVICPCRRSDG